ncbi:MAG: diadenylate cyclase CdaA [Cyclobacteriaceae bacterium]
MIYLFKIGFMEVDWVDIFDVLLVSILLTQAYKLIRGSVAIRVFLGFLSLYLIYLIVRAAEMELLTNILGQFMGVGVIAVIILFQQEIRKFLLVIGRTTAFDRDNILKNIGGLMKGSSSEGMNITPIVEASKAMGGSNTGALMVISKNSGLKFYAESGDPIDAIVSKRLLMAIFNKYSPLHDGAVIIYKNKIVAARCILPVTEQTDLPAQFGLRHRAAIGMSEITDALLVIVSEETGQISSVRNGDINHNLAPNELRKTIHEYLVEEDSKKESSEKRKESEPVKPEKPEPANVNTELKPEVAEESNPMAELMEEVEDTTTKKAG